MEIGMILVATVIILCILAEKFSGKFGMPALLLFMMIGMFFGTWELLLETAGFEIR